MPLTLAKDAPGKEILYPTAAVILGGLLPSTLLDIVVTPVVSRLLGRRALARYQRSQSVPGLTSALDAPPSTQPANQHPASA